VVGILDAAVLIAGVVALEFWRPASDVEGHLAFVPSAVALGWAGATDATRTLRGAARWYRVPVLGFVGTLVLYLILGVVRLVVTAFTDLPSLMEEVIGFRFSLFLGLVLGMVTAVVGVLVVPANRYVLRLVPRHHAGCDSRRNDL
jgi:hypothetical protein